MTLLLMKHAQLPDDNYRWFMSADVPNNNMTVFYNAETHQMRVVLYIMLGIPGWVADVGIIHPLFGVLRQFTGESVVEVAEAVLFAFYQEFTFREGLITRAVLAGSPYCSPADLAGSIVMSNKALQTAFYAQFGTTPDAPDAVEIVIDKLTNVGDLSAFEDWRNDDDEQ